MNFLNIFKRAKDNLNKTPVLQASATLYPDKILIETIDSVREGFGISSTNISTLLADIEEKKLGSVIRYHFSLTRNNLPIPQDYKKHYSDFLKMAGFKNGKEHHRNALYLTLHQKKDTITISPTKNGGATGKDRGFSALTDTAIVLNKDIDDIELGKQVRLAWAKCQCNYI